MTESEAKRVFSAALDVPSEDRSIFLDKACGDNAGLRSRVEALLRAHDAADAFLEDSPAVAEAPDTPALQAETAGERIGPYKLLQQIGEGGFGSVWMAEQLEPVRRKVALKIIKLGMDTRHVVARFEQERQALAMMDHPNIAKVLDAGATETGRPYFVMELVKGSPIVEYADKNNLTIAERLELFAQVCHAVQHAHGKGIIHRDLKPSNVLVGTHDGRPLAKVIDFGIAKATSQSLTDKTLFTQHEQVIGTLVYMSPEQAEGSLDLDTRTDVYSLGVVLYELLVGEPPFSRVELQQAGMMEVQRILREVEPKRPSTRINESRDTLASLAAHRHTEPKRLGGLVRGDLDWIVMKALEKDRARRYETVNGLVMDIQRHVAGEAVVAAPPSTGYRLRKFVRRNKAAVTAGLAVSLALVVGLGAATWGYFEAEAQRDAATTETVRANTVIELVEEMLGSADPSQVRGINYTVRQLLDDFAHGLGDELAGQPEVEASVRHLIGTAYNGLGLDPKAVTQLRSAVELLRELHGDEPHPQLAASLRVLGMSLASQDDVDEGESLLREAIAMQRELFGETHAELAQSLQDLSWLLRRQRDVSGCEAAARESLAIRQRLYGDEHQAVARAMSEVATALLFRDEIDAAEPICRAALAMHRRTAGRDHPDEGTITNLLGMLLSRQGRLVEAEQTHRDSLAHKRRTIGEENPNVAYSLSNLASVLRKQGRLEESLEATEQALAMRRKLFGRDHRDIVRGLMGAARTLKRLERPAEAEPLQREALAMRRRMFGDEHTSVADTLTEVASTLTRLERHAEAESLQREALAILRRLRDEHAGVASAQSRLDGIHAAIADSLNEIGTSLRNQRKFAEAEARHREAIDLLRERFGNTHSEVARSLNLLGRVLIDQGKRTDAVRVQEEALVITRELFGEDSSEIKGSYVDLGKAYTALGEHDKAEKAYRAAIEITRKRVGTNNRDYAAALHFLAYGLLQAGKLAEAEELYRQILAINIEFLGAKHPTVNYFHSFLADVLARQNKLVEAAEQMRLLYEGRIDVLGPEHRVTLSSLQSLAGLLRRQGKLAEAEPRYRELLRVWRKQGRRDAQMFAVTLSLAQIVRSLRGRTEESVRVFREAADLHREALDSVSKQLAADDPQLAGWFAMAGFTLVELERFAEAEPVLRQCLEIRTAKMPGHWLTFSTMSMLGGALAGQGKHTEADPLLVEGYDKMLPPEDPSGAGAARKREALDRLIAHYESWGKPDEAAKWRVRRTKDQKSPK